MNKQTSGKSENPIKPSRPSLYGNGMLDQGGEDRGFSILAGLEPSPKKKARRTGRAWNVLIGATLMTALFIASSIGSLHELPFHPSKEVISQQNAEPLMMPPVASLPSTALKEESAAAIVTEVEAARSGSHTIETNRDEAIAVQASSDTASPAIGDPAHDKSTASTFVAPIDTGKASRPIQEKKVATLKDRGNAKTRENRDSISKRTSTTAKNSSKDKDVELIAALLTHVSRPSGSAKDAQKKGDVPVASNRERVADPNREIIMRGTGESTESLVQRCATLGFLEGELCRLRICAGIWGKDTACPSGVQAASNQ